MNLGIIIIVFIILSFLCIYLLAYTNQTNEILNKINPREDRSFLGGIDFIELIKVLRNNKELAEIERRFLRNVLILVIVSMTLIIVWAFFVFGTEW